MRYSCIILILMLAGSTSAKTWVAVGMSGSYFGRNVPGLHLGVPLGDYTVTASSSGVRTPLYYHNAYMGGVYRNQKVGEFIWGELEAGFGVTVGHMRQGYREDEDSEVTSEDASTYGPGCVVQWQIVPGVVFTMETLLGISFPEVVGMSFQETVVTSLGVGF